MLAKSISLAIAFDMHGEDPLEVVMEILVRHLIDKVERCKLVLHELERVAEVGADEFVMLEGSLFDLFDQFVEVTAGGFLQTAHVVASLQMVLGETAFVVVGVLLAAEQAEVFPQLLLADRLLFAFHVVALVVPLLPSD